MSGMGVLQSSYRIYYCRSQKSCRTKISGMGPLYKFTIQNFRKCAGTPQKKERVEVKKDSSFTAITGEAISFTLSKFNQSFD